ncbi:ubiquilin-1-like [Melopsittacus undulatus]|uniref:ubiquilin-1-like n=1 Tax=Melopsittacus undulatus TaxID=13146 RepID=UPI00146DACC0|nr:ubiquilin-1-like [Melopsittacus undulatus]
MSAGRGAAQPEQPRGTADPSGIIRVSVKTLKQKEQFEVAQDSTIRELKEEVSKRFQAPPELLVLVFAGKVLQDQDTLSQHGVCNGVSIHVVIRSQNRPADSLAQQGTVTTLVQAPSRSHSSLGSVDDLWDPGLIHHNLSEMLASSREVVVQTMEDLLSRIFTSGLDLTTIRNNTFLMGFLLGVIGVHLLGLDSTDVLDLVGSIQEEDVSMPTLLTEVLQSPMDGADLIRELIMSNPQLQQLAEENPELGHILSNPDTIREMLEAFSSPAVMQEMIRNQDLAMSNLESIPGGYSALEQLYREVEEPFLDAVEEHMVQNPFAAPESRPSPSRERLPAHTENRSPLPNPWAPEPGSAGGTAQELPGHRAAESFVVLNLGAAVPNSGVVQSMVRRLAGSPELMHNLSRALAEPGSPAQEVLSPHAPGDGSSVPPEQQELPPELEQAEIASVLRNPRALQALLQIHLGLQTLSVEAPDFLHSIEDARMELGLRSMDGSPVCTEASVVSDEEGAEDEMEMDEEELQSLFEQQMEQLSAMGFKDQGANLQALLDADGELHTAAEILAKARQAKKMP